MNCHYWSVLLDAWKWADVNVGIGMGMRLDMCLLRAELVALWSDGCGRVII
jgi:hypothetical protein